MSDPTMWYGKEEWLQLILDTQQRILKEPAREHVANERRSKKRKSTSTTAPVTTNKVNPEHNRLVAVIINGVQNVSQHKHPQSTLMIQYPSKVIQITAAANVTNNNNSDRKNYTSVITYEHLGKSF